MVSGTGDVQPGSVQTPNWTVGGDLTVGDTATGALTIDAGATVSTIWPPSAISMAPSAP